MERDCYCYHYSLFKCELDSVYTKTLVLPDFSMCYVSVAKHLFSEFGHMSLSPPCLKGI